MPTIHIDGRPYTVRQGQNLLHACLSLGFDIPYFCWHPAMGSVGACRQCAVKQFEDEDDKKGRIVMACMTPAEDGTRISIDDPEARAFRAAVIEWLMLNHPHDCPVCDEGGECHLQDMTVMTGHNYRRSRFPKRTHRNQDLGPFLHHEMNRCIQCYRCIRFYCDLAGGRDLNAFGSHDHVYFGRQGHGPLENPFSGNLVEICPTGVFTDRTLKRSYSRKWDLQTAPSVCPHCGLGCNTLPGERYGTLRRVRNRYHHEINGYFLCDRGRYGYEYVNSDGRIRTPRRRRNREYPPEPVPGEDALAMAGVLLQSGGPVIGIGSPRASLEANFTLRALAGADGFFAGVSDPEWDLVKQVAEIYRRGPAAPACLRDAADADAVFILGEDVTNTAPILALKLRQFVHIQAARIARESSIPDWDDAGIREVGRTEKETLFVAAAHPSFLDDAAKVVCRAHPEDLARLGFHVAARIGGSTASGADLPGDLEEPAARIAEALENAQRPLVVSGSGCRNSSLLAAAAEVSRALVASGRDARLVLTVPECNSLGLELLEPRGGIECALAALEKGENPTLILLETDFFRRTSAETAERMLRSARRIICIDHWMHETADRADILLPAATVAESSGTLVNSEGRAQRFFRVFSPPKEIRESWRWLRDLAVAGGRGEFAALHTLDDLLARMAETLPMGDDLRRAAPNADFRVLGRKIPRQRDRWSGRTAVHAHISVHEPRPERDGDGPLAFSMEGHDGPGIPAALLPDYWAPGWNSVQALNKFQEEVAGPLRGGDAGIRLIAPPDSPGPADRSPPAISAASSKRTGDERWLAPLHHVFGSEELSVRSPGVAARSPEPYLALSPEDAVSLGLGAGETATVSVNGLRLDLPVRLAPGLAAKTAGLPVGLPGMPALPIAAVVRIARKEAADE